MKPINILRAVTAALCGIANSSQATFLPAGLYDSGVDGSGVSLVGGSIDLHYTLNSGQAVVVNAGFPIPPWLDYGAVNGASRWISADSAGGGGYDALYSYTTTFTLGSAAGLVLSGKWSADNDSVVLLNGHQIGSQLFSDVDGNSFSHYNSFSTSAFLLSGVNTLIFAVHNGYVPAQEGDAGPFGLRTQDLTISAVPEPTTIIAGALLLLPFGLSTLRILRRNRAA